MYLLIPFIMAQYASVRYILYTYKWYQQIHIVPLSVVSIDTYCTIINGINRYILYHYKWYQQMHIVWYNMYLLIPFIMVQYVSIDTIYNGTIGMCWYHLVWYTMYLLIPFIMVQYVSCGINRYILYHYKWHQQIHIVPL
jgi:hypothetical protein